MENPLTRWLDNNFPDVDAKSFYRTIFPAGELEKKGEYVQGKYTGIVVAVTGKKRKNGKAEIKRYSITDDLGVVDQVTASDSFCLCSPISYAGKQRTAEHARMLYAIAVDLDHVRISPDGRPVGLMNLWERHVSKVKRLPKPTFIVSSGTGVHLYFVLDRPIALFANTVEDLQDYKRELTRLIWHDTIVDIRNPADIQQEGIFQGFRMPGTVTKRGDRARAYLTGDKVTMDYLNGFVDPLYRVSHFVYKSDLRLEDAKEKYPDWYQRRIVNKEGRKTWAVNRNVYDWWLREIEMGAAVGHRYYCMMMLAIYARKCSNYDEKHNPNPVTREELEKDCFELVDLFDSLTIDDDNHFDRDDVLDALEAYDDRWITFPRSSIEYRSGIIIQPNKRKGLSQADHLAEARAIRDVRCKRRGEAWDAHNGRKNKAELVLQWRQANPDGSKADCIRDTGLTRPTVKKWWDAALLNV